MNQARTVGRRHPAPVRICWDLDNTLANSGVLLRSGMTLQDAIVEADPVPNMIPFYRALQSSVPDSEQFILSARMRSMRRDTLAWLLRHGLVPRDGTVCFVPSPVLKPRVWQQLARDSQLVIVDDLSYGHEGESTSTYDDLVDCAQRTASVYIGVAEIDRIAASAEAVDEVVSWTVALLGADGPGTASTAE